MWKTPLVGNRARVKGILSKTLMGGGDDSKANKGRDKGGVLGVMPPGGIKRGVKVKLGPYRKKKHSPWGGR